MSTTTPLHSVFNGRLLEGTYSLHHLRLQAVMDETIIVSRHNHQTGEKTETKFYHSSCSLEYRKGWEYSPSEIAQIQQLLQAA